MNTLVLNKKEMLLMKFYKNERNKTDKEKQIDKIEKIKSIKQEQPIYKRESIKLVEKDLTTTMKGYFEREPFQNACINLSLASTRQEILDNVPESEIEYNWVDNNYECVFNKVKKIYENDMKAKQEIQNMLLQKQLEQQRIQEEKDAKFERNVMGFFSVLKWICIVIFLPIVLLFIIVYTFAKGK